MTANEVRIFHNNDLVRPTGSDQPVDNYAALIGEKIAADAVRNAAKIDPGNIRAARDKFLRGQSAPRSFKPRAQSLNVQASTSSARSAQAEREVGKEADIVSSDVERELVDAKIALSETRTDVKFAQLNGRFDQLLSAIQKSEGAQTARALASETQAATMRADVKAEAAATRATTVNVGFGLAGLVVTIAAMMLGVLFALPSIYSLGTSTQS